MKTGPFIRVLAWIEMGRMLPGRFSLLLLGVLPARELLREFVTGADCKDEK